MRSILVLASILALTACRDDGPDFRQISYFKSTARDRVFVMQASKEASPDEVEAFARRQMHTDGHVTMVYVYEASATAPGDLVTLQPDLFSANTVMMDTPAGRGWRWLFLQDHIGQIFFTDCKLGPDEDCNP